MEKGKTQGGDKKREMLLWVMCKKVCTTFPSMYYGISCYISCRISLTTITYMLVMFRNVTPKNLLEDIMLLVIVILVVIIIVFFINDY